MGVITIPAVTMPDNNWERINALLTANEYRGASLNAVRTLQVETAFNEKFEYGLPDWRSSDWDTLMAHGLSDPAVLSITGDDIGILEADDLELRVRQAIVDAGEKLEDWGAILGGKTLTLTMRLARD